MRNQCISSVMAEGCSILFSAYLLKTANNIVDAEDADSTVQTFIVIEFNLFVVWLYISRMCIVAISNASHCQICSDFNRRKRTMLFQICRNNFSLYCTGFTRNQGGGYFILVLSGLHRRAEKTIAGDALLQVNLVNLYAGITTWWVQAGVFPWKHKVKK